MQIGLITHHKGRVFWLWKILLFENAAQDEDEEIHQAGGIAEFQTGFQVSNDDES